MVTFLGTFLQYKNHFATTAFSTGLLNLALIGALLLSREMEQEMIVYYLSFGVVIGGALQLFVHIVAIYKVGLAPLFYGGVKYFNEKKNSIKKETSGFSKQFFPAIWGNSTASFSAFLDTWLASFLITGSISYLYFANRVFQLPLALFAIATSVALFPRVSRLLKNNDEEKALSYMTKAFWFLTIILTMSGIVGLVLAQEITALLFERGAFTHEDTLSTTTVLQMYLIGLLPFGLSKLFALWLYAKEQQLKAAKIATYTLGSNIVLSLALIIPLEAMGLALASSLSGLVGFFFTLKAFGSQNILAILSKKYALLLILSALITLLLSYALKELIHVYL